MLLFSHSAMSDSLWPRGLQHARLPLSFTISWSLLKLMSIELVMPCNYLILCHPHLLLPSIFPSIRVFSNESVLSPVAYGASTNLGSLSFTVIFFLPFHTVHGVLKTRILKWFAIPFSSGTRFVKTLHHDPSVFVALHGMAHSFIELDKAVVHVIILLSFLWLWFSVCLPSDGGLWRLPDGRDWLKGKLGLVLMDGAVLSKSLIQFSVDGWGCVPFLLLDLKPNYGRANDSNSDLLQRNHLHCCS